MTFETAVSWNQRVAIVGIGQTAHRQRRPDVNEMEMVNEAVREALDDAQLTPKDIDANVIGNMDHFEGIYEADMWHVDGYGGYLTPGLRITGGGTSGGYVTRGAVNLVASGVYDVVMAIAWEKLEEIPQTTSGIVNARDPLWFKWISSGAVHTADAVQMIKEYGSYAEEMAAKLRVELAEGASRNPKAHLRQKLTMQEVMKSPYLVYPLRYLHMCPQSNGAVCLILASENKAKKITKKPVWVKDYVHVSVNGLDPHSHTSDGKPMQQSVAEKLYKRNGITNPLKQIDMFEMYNPSVWWQMPWIELFLQLPHGENLKMIERGDTGINGSFPICPSGGVVATNPIGATSMIRVAEAALQVRGDAGEHQVAKNVKTAMASNFGGGGTILWLLSKSMD